MSALREEVSRWGGFLGAGFLLAGGAVYLVTGKFDLATDVLLALGVVLLIAFLGTSSGAVKRSVTGRQARYGSNAAAMVVIFIVIVGLVNFVASRNPQRFDLTKTGTYTLSPQTIEVLQKLKDPVKVVGFFQGTDQRQTEANDLLKEYTYRSDKLKVEFVDPDVKPSVARQYGLQGAQDYGTIVFQQGDRKQKVTSAGEQEFTSALLKLTLNQQKKVYFLTGHGEPQIDGSDQGSFSDAKKALEDDGYVVSSLNLATASKVPTDTTVLAISDPEKSFLDNEKKAIADYLDTGGKALVLADPRNPAGIDDVVAKWGVTIGRGIVLDPASSLQGNPEVPVVARYGFSQITKGMTAMTLFPLSTSVTRAQETPKGLSVNSILQTTEESWLETDPSVGRFDPGVDPKGPLDLGVTIEQTPDVTTTTGVAQPPSPKARLVVIADVDFATNQFFPALGNKDLFVNSVNWLAEDEQLISIRPKLPEDNQVYLTGSQKNIVLYSSMIFLPALVIAAGAIVWWRRR